MFDWNKAKDLDAKVVGKNWPVYLILGIVVLTMIFFGVWQPGSGSLSLPGGSAATIDGESVSSLQFRRAYIRQSETLREQYKEKFDPVALNVAGQVLDSLVEREVLYKEAKKNGLMASDSEVEKAIIDSKYWHGENGKFDPQLFNNFLKNQGYTEADLTEEFRKDLTIGKYRNLLFTSYRPSEKLAELNYTMDESKVDVDYIRLDANSLPLTIAPADIDAYLAGEGAKAAQSYYDQNKAEFNAPAKVKARHILIQFEGARSASAEAAKRSKADAKAQADKVLAEAKKPGADFAALATRFTDEASGKTKGGDLGFFTREQMVKEFSDAAFALKPGQVSNVVESPFGFHIIRVDTVQDAKSVSFDDAKRGIAEKQILAERRPKLLDERAAAILADLKAGKAVTGPGTEWRTTGAFNAGGRFIPGLGAEPAINQAIASLKTPGQLYPEVVTSNGSKLILRLKSRQQADLAALTPEKRKELTDMSRFMDLQLYGSAMSQDIVKRYKEDKKVSLSKEYVEYDRQFDPAQAQ